MNRSVLKLFVCVLFVFGSFACAGRQNPDSGHSCRVGMTKQIAAVVVNCDAPISELVRQGRYNGVDTLTGNTFPDDQFCGRGRVGRILWLVNFNHVMTTRDARRHLREAGMRPATLRELLSFGIMHPNMLGEFAVVSLDSCSFERSLVPVLAAPGGRRSLLAAWLHAWDEDTRFLAVRLADR